MCFLANLLEIGNILKSMFSRFQMERLTIGECKDELLEAIRQVTLLCDGEGYRTHKTNSLPDMTSSSHVIIFQLLILQLGFRKCKTSTLLCCTFRNMIPSCNFTDT